MCQWHDAIYHRTIEKGGVTIQESMHRRVIEIENEPYAISLLSIQWIAAETCPLMAWCNPIDGPRFIGSTEETTAC
jgi:hypothetical protein